MSRVATSYPTTRYNNGVGQASTSFLSRSSSNSSSSNSMTNGNSGRGVTVRSAAPPPAQKETVHACPLCNHEYKDPRVLPCTHTYCLNCIRDKLMHDDHVTCAKCQHKVQPFDEADLNELPRNLILSQEWRMNTRAIPSLPIPKKPVTYQPPTQMSIKQDKPKLNTTENNNNHHDTSLNGTSSHGITALVSAFNKSSENNTGNGERSSRSSSVTSAQPIVQNLVKIYTEASTTPKQQHKQRDDSVVSTGKHDELTKIFEQAASRSQRQQQQQTASTSIIKQPSRGYEEAYEEITWDSLVHGTTPVAPPFPDQWQTATENHHHPPKAPERPISATSSDRHSNVDNLHDIIASIHHQKSNEKTSPSFPPGPILDSRLNSRPSTASHSQIDPDEDDDHRRPPTQQQSIYTTILPRQHSPQGSTAGSIRSADSISTSRHSPAPSLTNNQQKRSNAIQQDDKMSHRTFSAESSRRSSDRFPPPPPNIDPLDFDGNDGTVKPKSTSSMSHRSSTSTITNQPITRNETNLLSTERFNLNTDIPHPVDTRNSLSNNSRNSSSPSTPTNRLISTSVERDSHYLMPTPSTSVNTAVTSRVDFLLSDQKRLEREIEEQIKHLKHDYNDVRKQITRKESSIQNEVKNIATRLDEDITEHYHRKQKIYENLAADTNTVRTELERLKSHTNTTNNNQNKQQLWANLEQIELNMRNIRQAVEQHKEPRSTLTFAEGHRTLGADTIGQITYNQKESHRRFNSPSPNPPPPLTLSSSFQQEQTSTNITPYKYIKIDHLSTLEPEAVAITENNKKILLGICNKLFILDEYGNTLRTISLTPSIRGIAVSKKHQTPNIAYISHDETVSMIDIDTGHLLDSVKETDSTGETGTFLPLGIDTDNTRGDVYVCDYRNSCVIKFDDKLEYITQWRIFNHSEQYDEARPKLLSVFGQRLYMIIEHSCKPYYNQGIAYTFSLHICDAHSGNIIKIIDADLLATQRLRWPCSVQAINNEKCYILDTMTSGKYFNGQWQKHWSRVLEIGQDDSNVVTELFQLDSEAATMAMTKQNMIIAANGDILFVDLSFLKQQQRQQQNDSTHEYQNLS
ncbi:unnamed protein product [Adineta steineri]|uniref:RING-type domain-containing protein n=1 Tax=Adineta steineri TaxID=433720 RepID=A0A815F8S8_9BILA|nr:unnamed protein product [Adineta steineri]